MYRWINSSVPLLPLVDGWTFNQSVTIRNLLRESQRFQAKLQSDLFWNPLAPSENNLQSFMPGCKPRAVSLTRETF
jgi:hypothetical protein